MPQSMVVACSALFFFFFNFWYTKYHWMIWIREINLIICCCCCCMIFKCTVLFIFVLLWDRASLNGTIVYFVPIQCIMDDYIVCRYRCCALCTRCVRIRNNRVWTYASIFFCSIAHLISFNSSAQSSLYVNIVWHSTYFFAQWICKQDIDR